MLKGPGLKKLLGLGMLAALLVAGTGAGGHAQENAALPNGALSLAAAVDIALINNPGLGEIQQRVRAAEAVPSQEGSLPDPVLGFAAMNLPADSFHLDQEPMTQVKIGISQSFPFPGKLRLKKEAAGFEAEAVAWSYQEARLILIRDTKSEWWQAFYLDRALEILDRNLDLLRGLVEIAGKKYEVGKGLQSDVVLAQLEFSKLLDVELRLKSARAASGARLGALLALPAGSAIRIAGGVSEGLLELPGEAALLELAEQNSPRLAVQENRLNAAEAREDYAKRDFYPDFTLSADYGFRKGFDQARNLERADFVSFGIGIKIPLYAGSKQSKALDQRRAERQEKMLSLAQIRLVIQRDIGTGLALYRQNREQVRLFGTGIIPQAQMTLDAMRAAYLVDEVDFLNLVSAEITLFNYETRYWQVLSEANHALALIEAAVGKELTNDHQ